MKITVMSLCRNEFPMLKFYLRCYEAIADEILVFDDKSNDGSRELLRSHPLVKLYDCPWEGIDEDRSLHHFYSMLAAQRGDGYAIVVDVDELLYCETPDGFRDRLYMSMLDIITTAGFNMFTDFTYNACLPMPTDELPYEHKQLWDFYPMGVSSPVYGKPIIVRNGFPVRWMRGRHQIEACNPTMPSKPWCKLLHYGFRHPVFLRAKNANNLERCVDKSVAWSCRPEYTGEHSATWAEQAKAKAFNVIEAPL